MKKSPSFIIQGLAGSKTLKGVVHIRGAKNAALKAMAASVLFDGPVQLHNVPDTDDIRTLSEILKKLGAKIVRHKKERVDDIHPAVLEIDTTHISSTDIDATLATNMRASVVLTGPLLARFGRVAFPAPGGCVIGTRPIDLFIEGYKKMGATVELKNGLYHITAPKGGLKSTDIFFNIPTVGGTETLMMAATLAKGKTVLKNCAMEPEIVNVGEWLKSCGAKISGLGTTTIEIEGLGGTASAAKLLEPRKSYIAIPDRIEAGSFLLLGALCAEDLMIENCEPKHIESLIHSLQISGVPIEVGTHVIRIKNNKKKNSTFKAFNVRTHEYPGFPTDLQSPLVTYMTQVSGESIIFETIFEGRFKYVEELEKLGADITVMNAREILVKGPSSFAELSGSDSLQAHDIRAGFAVVMAALVGNGQYTVDNVHLIDRGYEKLEERLKEIGVDIKRV